MDKKDYRLKGHESFTLREGWLTKGLNAVHENPTVFSENSGADALGVGTNMAKSIRYWLRTAELTEEHQREGVTLTEYGDLIFRKDPYFEDIFSLWVIHANISRNFKLATSWNIFFNNIDVTSFKREELISMMTENIINITGDTTPPERSITDDCAAILQMYTENGDAASDPEEKRKIIGGEFIRVFEEEARKLEGIDFLGQGTIYPDIIESGTKTAKMVKSHHNVGGLPEDLQFELVEPLKQLFKDEVRACGIELGLPAEMVYRQPFPGPGLGVRCLGAITRDRLEAVRESDAILREEFAKAGLDKKVWQYFTVVPDFKSVGMKNHARCFEYMVIIRAINTIDAMTASIEHVDWEILDRITNRILAEVENVNRVCYDMSPKPPATIEFE